MCVSALATDISPDTPLHMKCGEGRVVTAVKFASYGTPPTCDEAEGALWLGACHAPDSVASVMALCKGNNTCQVPQLWGADPCPSVSVQRVTVAVQCGAARTAGEEDDEDGDDTLADVVSALTALGIGTAATSRAAGALSAVVGAATTGASAVSSFPLTIFVNHMQVFAMLHKLKVDVGPTMRKASKRLRWINFEVDLFDETDDRGDQYYTAVQLRGKGARRRRLLQDGDPALPTIGRLVTDVKEGDVAKLEQQEGGLWLAGETGAIPGVDLDARLIYLNTAVFVGVAIAAVHLITAVLVTVFKWDAVRNEYVYPASFVFPAAHMFVFLYAIMGFSQAGCQLLAQASDGLDYFLGALSLLVLAAGMVYLDNVCVTLIKSAMGSAQGHALLMWQPRDTDSDSTHLRDVAARLLGSKRMTGQWVPLQLTRQDSRGGTPAGTPSGSRAGTPKKEKRVDPKDKLAFDTVVRTMRITGRGLSVEKCTKVPGLAFVDPDDKVQPGREYHIEDEYSSQDLLERFGPLFAGNRGTSEFVANFIFVDMLHRATVGVCVGALQGQSGNKPAALQAGLLIAITLLKTALVGLYAPDADSLVWLSNLATCWCQTVAFVMCALSVGNEAVEPLAQSVVLGFFVLGWLISGFVAIVIGLQEAMGSEPLGRGKVVPKGAVPASEVRQLAAAGPQPKVHPAGTGEVPEVSPEQRGGASSETEEAEYAPPSRQASGRHAREEIEDDDVYAGGVGEAFAQAGGEGPASLQEMWTRGQNTPRGVSEVIGDEIREIEQGEITGTRSGCLTSTRSSGSMHEVELADTV